MIPKKLSSQNVNISCSAKAFSYYRYFSLDPTLVKFFFEQYNKAMSKNFEPAEGLTFIFRCEFCFIFFIRVLICSWNFRRSVRTGPRHMFVHMFWAGALICRRSQCVWPRYRECGPSGGRCLNVTDICNVRSCRTIFPGICPPSIILLIVLHVFDYFNYCFIGINWCYKSNLNQNR